MKKTTITTALAAMLCLCAYSQESAAPQLVIPSLPQPSQLEKDKAGLMERIQVTAEAMNNLAAKMASESAKTWSLPDDRLLALLNADVDFTVQMQALNDQLAALVNAYLEGAKQLGFDRYTARAPVGFGREDVTLNAETGLFEIVPPEPAEPEE